MCNTHDAVAVDALRQRVCRLITCVPYAGRSDELWRFSTSTKEWERVDSTTANGARPSARQDHVMTSVGMDLWVHGGDTDSGEGDVFEHT
jgi:hypothetical protein